MYNKHTILRFSFFVSVAYLRFVEYLLPKPLFLKNNTDTI